MYLVLLYLISWRDILIIFIFQWIDNILPKLSLDNFLPWKKSIPKKVIQWEVDISILNSQRFQIILTVPFRSPLSIDIRQGSKHPGLH